LDLGEGGSHLCDVVLDRTKLLFDVLALLLAELLQQVALAILEHLLEGRAHVALQLSQ
jgi:hypothetical protein